MGVNMEKTLGLCIPGDCVDVFDIIVPIMVKEMIVLGSLPDALSRTTLAAILKPAGGSL